MKKLFKIIFIFVFFISNFSIINLADTNKIDEVDIKIKINPDGNAEVTEIWKANIYYGTELYHAFDKKSSEKITNFSVYEDNKKFEKKENWEIVRRFKFKEK